MGTTIHNVCRIIHRLESIQQPIQKYLYDAPGIYKVNLIIKKEL